MGAWGVAIFSDDLAADLRDDFRDMIGEGFSSSEAVERLLRENAGAVADGDEAPVFWLALAAIQWKLGRLEDRTKRKALAVIDSESDLKRWDIETARKKRKVVLEKLREQLLSPQPPAGRVPRRIVSANDWTIGEVVAFSLLSGKFVLLRVIGHHSDKGGRSAVCELLDWIGEGVPPIETIKTLSVRTGVEKRPVMQFLFQDPRKKQDRFRLQRLQVICSPTQKCGGYTIFVWPFVDQLMKRCYGIE